MDSCARCPGLEVRSLRTELVVRKASDDPGQVRRAANLSTSSVGSWSVGRSQRPVLRPGAAATSSPRRSTAFAVTGHALSTPPTESDNPGSRSVQQVIEQRAARSVEMLRSLIRPHRGELSRLNVSRPFYALRRPGNTGCHQRIALCRCEWRSELLRSWVRTRGMPATTAIRRQEPSGRLRSTR